jgi:ketosteroid isomerase-like protein
MADADTLDGAIERYHQTLAEFIRGDPEPFKGMFAQEDAMTLANPFGPVRRGWTEAVEAMENAAAFYRDGEVVGFDELVRYVTAELAYIVEVERYRIKVAGDDDFSPVDLRVTSVLRPEAGGWKVIHRHADPIVTDRPPHSVVQA